MATAGYLSQDTIAAVATPLGGAVSIVRMSGPLALGAAQRLAPSLPPSPQPRILYRAKLIEPSSSSRGRQEDEPREIDDALVVFFRSPQSFTGEDCIEFQIHGSPVVARSLLDALSRLGVRQALAGEFSFRAVRNGKFTVSQAEATADLIAASNTVAVTLALEKLSGSQNVLLRDLGEALRKLAAMGEVGIDFSDQDVEEVSLPALKKRVAPIYEIVSRLESSYARGVRIQTGVSAAFVGQPNVGKSSFFNALLGEERAIVSDIAGTTRDIVREQVTLQGSASSVTIRLADTAGLRETEDKIEKMGVELTQRAARDADLVLLLVDAATPSIEEITQEWKKIGEPRARALGVLTKTDLAGPDQIAATRERVKSLGINRWCETSSQTGEGVADAARAIADFCESWVQRDPGEVVLTRLSHRQAAQLAMTHLERAQGSAQIDLFAADLRQALSALGPMIGETLPDDLLGQIFSKFCIGK